MANERLPELIASVPPGETYFSLEFFPPKTQAGFNNLQSRLSRMAVALKPLYVTVTWGAGGSTSSKSLELAEICQRQLGMPTVLHLTCTNMRKSMVDDTLDACKELGIRNILALRGDPPREEYREEDASGNRDTGEDEFVWAVDLVTYIRKRHGDYFSIGVAGYPEGHADESNPEAGKQSVEYDLPYLVEKTQAGADFIMTQLSYDLDAYDKYERRLRTYETASGEKPFERIPIIPGLMPIQSYQIVKRITKLSHAKIPQDIARRIEAVKDDDEAVKKVGVDILSELVEGIKGLQQPAGLPRGLHFYTLNLEKSVAFILERCHLIPHMNEPEPDESSDSDAVQDGAHTNGTNAHAPPPSRFSRRRASSVNAQPHNRVILDSLSGSPGRPRTAQSQDSNGSRHEALDRGTGIPAADPTRKHSLLISEGQGSLGREATWDDFPNGRWGPAHSPAYGEIDGYGPSLKVGPATARKLWGNPTTPRDVTNLFSKLITGALTSVPWSDEVDPNAGVNGPGSLRAETQIIRNELLELIERKRYWTLASQPAVDGVRSDNEVFGWGPRAEGFVFQKAFVEFFCSKGEWEGLLRKKLIETSPEQLSWMKTDALGIYESSDTIINAESKQGKPTSKKTPGTNGINAVTWGVFRGKEIIAPTIIESESFRAWGEEAFAIWGEWRRCYPRGSKEELCLEDLRKDIVLVNVVGQEFVGGHQGRGRTLWDILLS
ncbi:methylenetetrahydrofolate reductase [Cyphellophora europaea CBS 101466]|uniref:Methylenetetrahydrofolate reductase n=1 Tax=Cyphellophora europaea (strain CBS 101466) TaxID=1220924 RepID=W2RK30_CYPE1|nr:methylenetetrahydrofolate reductase [Cyphellophora europaea CBS 101466]ETN36700.1 methylenetetrahydrofolate reductase [Cyphellophora europaea CBS 101466]